MPPRFQSRGATAPTAPPPRFLRPCPCPLALSNLQRAAAAMTPGHPIQDTKSSTGSQVAHCPAWDQNLKQKMRSQISKCDQKPQVELLGWTSYQFRSLITLPLLAMTVTVSRLKRPKDITFSPMAEMLDRTPHILRIQGSSRPLHYALKLLYVRWGRLRSGSVCVLPRSLTTILAQRG